MSRARRAALHLVSLFAVATGLSVAARNWRRLWRQQIWKSSTKAICMQAMPARRIPVRAIFVC